MDGLGDKAIFRLCHNTQPPQGNTRLGVLYLCRFLLTAISVPVVFFLLLGFLLFPFFMFLLFLLLSGAIVAGDAVRVLAIVPLSVWISVYIAFLGGKEKRGGYFKKNKKKNKRWWNVVREEKSKAFQLYELTSFFRFFVLAGFPSFSFFFASFFFFGRPFFLDGTSLSNISGSSSKRGGERKIDAWKKDSYQNQMNNNLLNARLIPAEHNYAQQKLRYGHGGFGDLWPRLNCDTCYIRYSLSEGCK